MKKKWVVLLFALLIGGCKESDYTVRQEKAVTTYPHLAFSGKVNASLVFAGVTPVAVRLTVPEAPWSKAPLEAGTINQYQLWAIRPEDAITPVGANGKSCNYQYWTPITAILPINGSTIQWSFPNNIRDYYIAVDFYTNSTRVCSGIQSVANTWGYDCQLNLPDCGGAFIRTGWSVAALDGFNVVDTHSVIFKHQHPSLTSYRALKKQFIEIDDAVPPGYVNKFYQGSVEWPPPSITNPNPTHRQVFYEWDGHPQDAPADMPELFVANSDTSAYVKVYGLGFFNYQSGYLWPKFSPTAQNLFRVGYSDYQTQHAIRPYWDTNPRTLWPMLETAADIGIREKGPGYTGQVLTAWGGASGSTERDKFCNALLPSDPELIARKICKNSPYAASVLQMYQGQEAGGGCEDILYVWGNPCDSNAKKCLRNGELKWAFFVSVGEPLPADRWDLSRWIGHCNGLKNDKNNLNGTSDGGPQHPTKTFVYTGNYKYATTYNAGTGQYTYLNGTDNGDP